MDAEKLPTSPAHFLYVHDIKLISRYRKQHEFSILAKMAHALFQSNLADEVSEIFCDSKAECAYTVECNCNSSEESIEEISERMHRVCLKENGGHNGMYINCGSRCHVVDPWWDEPYLEDEPPECAS